MTQAQVLYNFVKSYMLNTNIDKHTYINDITKAVSEEFDIKDTSMSVSITYDIFDTIICISEDLDTILCIYNNTVFDEKAVAIDYEDFWYIYDRLMPKEGTRRIGA